MNQFTILVFGLGCGLSHAAITTATSFAPNVAGVPPYSALNNDLLQLGGTVITSVKLSERNGQLAPASDISVLANGGIDGNPTNYVGPSDPTPLSIVGSGSDSANYFGDIFSSVTFSLDLGASPTGYDITRIATYGGWVDQGRDMQSYTVLYSTVSDPTNFLSLYIVDYDPANSANASVSTRVLIQDLDDNLLASGVHSLRFVFNETENGGAGYSEFDVVGTATIPEPGAAFLLLAGVGPFFLLRRRSHAR